MNSNNLQIAFESRHMVNAYRNLAPVISDGPDAFKSGDRNDFQIIAQGNISTLAPFNGLAYVPTLLNAANCQNASVQRYIPDSVTTKSNTTIVLNTPVPAIAFFPWFNDSACLSEYIYSARFHGAAVIWTYLTDNSSTVPPPANDSAWNINGTSDWQHNVLLPIVALNSSLGFSAMAALTEQSNTGTVAPDYNGTTDAWLLARMEVPASSGGFAVVPDLWTIVLAVLAAFVCVLAVISGFLHFMQGRRRRDLRRRIAAGEVDLSILGIRKLTVPQSLLDKIPVKPYSDVSNAPPSAAIPQTYTTNTENPDPAVLAEKSASVSTTQAPATIPASPSTAQQGSMQQTFFNQPTCAICIDDFESDTPVRFLPCGHIFHPACVDPHFLENSSLCPICKKSVLPHGYCPTKVTNAMVRRERIANLRDQEANGNGQPTSRIARLGLPIRSRTQATGDAGSEGTSPMSRVHRALTRSPRPDSTTMELRETAPITSTHTTSVPLPPPPPEQDCPSHASPETRREWARRRALQLLGTGRPVPTAAAEEIARADEEQQRRRPVWRKIVGVVFPSRGS